MAPETQIQLGKSFGLIWTEISRRQSRFIGFFPNMEKLQNDLEKYSSAIYSKAMEKYEKGELKQDQLDLIEALEKKPPGTQRDLLLERAKGPYYSNLAGEPALPKMQLYRDLIKAGFRDLADRIGFGEFDY